MPIFVPCPPAGGGGFAIAGGTVLTSFESLITGFTAAINYQSGIFDDIANRVIFAGNNDFIGSMAAVGDKLQAAPSFPASNNTCRGIAIERLTGGCLFLDSANGIFLSDADLDNWAAIASGAAAVKGIFALTDTNNIYVVFDTLAAPNRNIAVSSDQGATWDINPGIFAPFTNDPRFTVMSPDKSVVAITATSGGDIAVSNDPVNTWVAHTVASANDVITAAFSPDNTTLVAIDSLGRIFWTKTPLVAGAMNEVPTAVNPYTQDNTSGRPGAFLEFVASVSGFVSMDNAASIAIRIPFDDPDTTDQGLYIGRAVTFPTTQRFSPCSVVDANSNLQGLCSSKLTIVFVT